MGYQVFPAPSTSGASLPPGATSLIFNGVATKGGFTYTSSTITSGPKLAYVNAGAGKTFVAFGKDNNKANLIASGNYGVINFSTSETSTTITDVASFSGARFTFSSSVAYRTLFSTSVGYLFMIVGNPVTIAITTDYVNWSTLAQWSTNDGNASQRNAQMAFGSGRYVALQGSQGVSYKFSTNGINWASRQNVNVNSDSEYGLGWNNGVFLVRQTDRLSTSTDGLNWTSQTASAVGFGAYGMFTKNGYFIIPPGNNQTYRQVMQYSTNGTTWATSAIPGPGLSTGYYSTIAYGNGVFVAAGTDSSLFPIAAVSTNLSTWNYVRVNSSTGSGIGYIQYSNGVFYANWSGAAQADGKFISIDGVNWTTIPTVAGEFVIDWHTDGNKSLFFRDNSGRDETGSATDQFFVTADNSTPYIELYNMSSTNLN